MIFLRNTDRPSRRAADAMCVDLTHLVDRTLVWGMRTMSTAIEKNLNQDGTKSASRLHVPAIMWTDAQTQSSSRSERVPFREKEPKSFCKRCRGQLKRHPSPRRVSRDQTFSGSFFQKRTSWLAGLAAHPGPVRSTSCGRLVFDAAHLCNRLAVRSTPTYKPDKSAPAASRTCMLPLLHRVRRAFAFDLPTPARPTYACKRHQAWTC